MDFPGNLNAAVARFVDNERDLRGGSQALTAAYKAGKNSNHISLGAYMATRVPATFAANQRVIAELHALRPGFAPNSVLDVGAGPGTGTWAALSEWPEISEVTQFEKLKVFAELANALNLQSNLPALAGAEVVLGDLLKLEARRKSDLVIASYVLAELPMAEIPAAAENLWQCTDDVLLLIEPGTPAGFARLRLVRDRLRGAGGHVVAPCTHQLACPMMGGDWCHFKVRVQRSRAHMHAKNAEVPFEDEAFSYLVLQRQVSQQPGGRVVAPVAINKVAVTFRLCTAKGFQEVAVASRDKPAYKRAKKMAWGDLWE